MKQQLEYKDEIWTAPSWDGDGTTWLFEQVVGNSGVYLIIRDEEGNIIRDDRPWQMKEGVS